jgi:hypothetical protein
LSRDQPVTATTSSRIQPLSFLRAVLYRCANRSVISAFICIESFFLMPIKRHVSQTLHVNLAGLIWVIQMTAEVSTAV